VNFGKFIAGRGLQPLQKFGALTVSRKQKIQYRDVNIPHFLLNKNHSAAVGTDQTDFLAVGNMRAGNCWGKRPNRFRFPVRLSARGTALI
jgi:hypothetical protein